jgi:hypothetical protein
VHRLFYRIEQMNANVKYNLHSCGLKLFLN